MNESTLSQLYSSAIAAYPKTTLRQHATDPIQIVEMNWTPFQGIRTLFISGKALNEGRSYKCHVLFKEVDYRSHDVKIVGSDKRSYEFGKIKVENNNVVLRCDCPDFRWRFNYYNHLDKSLWGTKRSPYESTTGRKINPTESPGMCKHLIKFCEALVDAGVLAYGSPSDFHFS